MNQLSESLEKVRLNSEWIEPVAAGYDVPEWLGLIDRLLNDADLMKYAKSKRRSDFTSLDELKNFLKQCPCVKTQCEAAWLVYVWMTDNIEYDIYVYRTGDFGELTAESTFNDGKSICEGFSNLFDELCRSLGIECHKIHGFCKGLGYESGRELRTRDRHAWNRLRVDGKWQLVDSTWGAGHLSYYFEKKFRPHFFLTPPQIMIYDHWPDQLEHQYLDRCISFDQFERMAYFDLSFHLLGLGSASSQSHLKFNSNPMIVEFSIPSATELTASLFDQTGTNVTRLVSVQRDLEKNKICFLANTRAAKANLFTIFFYAHNQNYSHRSRFSLTLEQLYLGRELCYDHLPRYSLSFTPFRIKCITHSSSYLRICDASQSQMRLEFEASGNVMLKAQLYEAFSSIEEDLVESRILVKQSTLSQRNPHTNRLELTVILPVYDEIERDFVIDIEAVLNHAACTDDVRILVDDSTNGNPNRFSFHVATRFNGTQASRETKLVRLATDAFDENIASLYLFSPIAYNLCLNQPYNFQIYLRNAHEVWLDGARSGKYEKRQFSRSNERADEWCLDIIFDASYNKSIELNAKFKNPSGLGYIHSICSYFLDD